MCCRLIGKFGTSLITCIFLMLSLYHYHSGLFSLSHITVILNHLLFLLLFLFLSCDLFDVLPFDLSPLHRDVLYVCSSCAARICPTATAATVSSCLSSCPPTVTVTASLSESENQQHVFTITKITTSSVSSGFLRPFLPHFSPNHHH